MRVRVLTTAAALAAVVLLVAGLVTYLLQDATVESRDGVESTLPVSGDMRDWSPNRGVIGTLRPPKGDKKGKIVLTGGRLDRQCEIYRKKSQGWACEGVRGLGTIGYAYDENVFTRVSSLVLTYEDDGAAEDAWQAMTDRTRSELKKLKPEESSSDQVGDESRSFTMPTGTVVVMRSGSVVAQAISHNDYGFDHGGDVDAEDPAGYGEVDDARKDPIEKWSTLQAKAVREALDAQ
jgi:hypothetical protein